MEFVYHICENMDDCEIWTAKGLNTWHILIRYDSATIKYCPFCGKKLKEKKHKGLKLWKSN